MTDAPHYLIIGTGSAGFGAATTLRAADAECRITMLTMSALPFYNRYDLPEVFRGRHDWRELLAVPPADYDDMGITLRRLTRVVDVNGKKRKISLAHQEIISYDRLLVCAGGRAYVPENIASSIGLMHGFGSFEAAMRVYGDLPEGGTVIMIGGDMIGIDLALTLLDTGYGVTLVTNQQTFWPHVVDEKARNRLLAALGGKGMKIVDNNPAVGIVGNNGSAPARTVTLADGAEIKGDVVMPFCGLASSVEFMLGAGVDIERGILVSPELCTTNDAIWAAGDICQIWHDEEKIYKFYHGWRNVRVMGELAARNMTGAHEAFDADTGDRLEVDEDGDLSSSFWTR